MDITHYATSRSTAKAFDPTRTLTAAQMAHIETLLRFTPSSTNSQPWHFIIAGTEAGKARVAEATSGRYAFNEPKIRNASHVVVLCSRIAVDTPYLETLVAQEERDGRFPNPEAREAVQRGRTYFVNMHRYELRDATHWADKQVYIALGTLLLGAATLGIDACPIEGFDARILDETFGLREKGLVSTVLVALGYRAPDDFNATLPKSRLPAEAIITRV